LPEVHGSQWWWQLSHWALYKEYQVSSLVTILEIQIIYYLLRWIPHCHAAIILLLQQYSWCDVLGNAMHLQILTEDTVVTTN
jgi:hypothetical protein